MPETENLAASLVQRLNRKNIFPPLYNDPESFVSKAGSKPKKPSNSFFICRRNVYKEAKRKGARNMRVISKATSMLWNSATSQEKDVYKRIADRVSEIHILRNSNLINATSFALFQAELTTQSPSALSFSPSISRQLPFPSPSFIFETFPNSNQSNTQINDIDQTISFNYKDFDENYYLPYNGFN